jgi:hypothetical protein
VHDDMDVVVADDVADLYQQTTPGRPHKHDQTLVIWGVSNNRIAISVKDLLLIQVMPVSTRSDNRLMPLCTTSYLATPVDRKLTCGQIRPLPVLVARERR